MTIAFIIGTTLILLGAGGAVYLIHHVYSRVIDTLSADNIDLRNRLFISRGQPPSGVNVTAQYEEKKEVERVRRENTEPRHRPNGPLDRIRSVWKEKDLSAKSHGVDVTSKGTH